MITTIKTLEARWQAHYAAARPEEIALSAGLITLAERRELDLRHQAAKLALEVEVGKLSSCICCHENSFTP